MTAYYNENDAYAAQWLRNLIAAGHIAPGEVDERSIADVRPDDLRGFTPCHFFAGIGVWSYALRLAGWSNEREVWTGSCPCQPFSAAGKGGADEDARHLWPHWLRLIAKCRPPVIFGEQVSAAIRIGWLDDVFTSLEQLDYACGAVDFPACSVGAPHIRQRIYFVADAERERTERRSSTETGQADARPERLRELSAAVGADSGTRSMADSNGRNTSTEGLQRSREHGQQQEDGGAGGLAYATRQQRDGSENGGQGRRGESSDRCVMGDAALNGSGPLDWKSRPSDGWQEPDRGSSIPGATNGFWRDAEWLPCIDGKARPVESGTFPLATVDPNRVGRLRAYGNAICAEQAAEFVRAYFDI